MNTYMRRETRLEVEIIRYQADQISKESQKDQISNALEEA